MSGFFKKTLLFLVVWVISLLCVKGVLAQDRVNYYELVFEDWGFEIERLDEVVFANHPIIIEFEGERSLEESSGSEPGFEQLNISSEDLLELFNNAVRNVLEDSDEEVKYSRYILTLSSDLNNSTSLRIPEGKTLIIICDSEFNFDQNIGCTYENVFSDQQKYLAPLASVFWYDTDVQLLNVNEYIIIPELHFVHPKFRDYIESYFIAFDRTLHVKEVNNEKDFTLGEELLNLRNSFLFEMFLYISSLFLFSIIFYKLFQPLITNPQKLLSSKLYKRYYNSILDFFEKYRSLTLYFSLISILFYFPLLIVISYRDMGGLNLNYIINYIFNSINPINFSNFALAEFRLAFILYTVLIVLLLFFFLLPDVLRMITIFTVSAFEKEVKTDFIKWALPILLILGAYVISSFNINISSATFVTLLLLLFIYLYFLAYRQNINFSNLYSLKEKLILFSVFTLMTFIGFGINYYFNINPKMKTENLIGVSSDMVILPYLKDFENGRNVRFNEFLVNFDFPVYIEDYLVYHPDFTDIENKNIEDYNNEENYIVLGVDDYKKVWEKFKKGDLGFLEQNEPSLYFYLDDLNYEYTDKFTIELLLDCVVELEPSKVTFSYLSDVRGDYSIEELNLVSHPILNFPGCERGEQRAFSVPLNFLDVLAEERLYKIEGINYEAISDFNIYLNGRELDLTFLNIPKRYELVESVGEGSEITAFGFNSEDLDVSRDPGKEFNLSEPINRLMEQDRLESPFRIWSTKENAIIVNKYLEQK